MKDELAEMGQQVIALVSERPAHIATDADLASATSWLARVRSRRKGIDAFFEKLIKPFRLAIQEHKKECDNMLAPLRTHEVNLDAEVRNYRQLQAKKAAEAQRKADEKHEQRIEKAVAKGQDPALVKPPPVVAAPAKTVETDTGKVTFRKLRKHKLRDARLVPKEYWIIDDTKVGKAVRAGIDVPGYDIWEEEASSVRDF
ncbi:hypothetical protein LCGC14_1807250 [marine sediment metagenome]|uniref:Uncharacterized protein n=1 Tax=marine sediment metagenome TaxID=412755 RepID=A0A0F9J2G0_9ZZZZ